MAPNETPAPPTRSPLLVEVLAFCQAQLARASASRPLVIGLQGPQGIGKTTLARGLLAALPGCGLSGAGVSIDDFYKTRASQLDIAATHPGNRYLEHRGYPGTHDIELGEQTLNACRLGDQGTHWSVAIPAYDKSAHGGRGDRAPRSAWRSVRMPTDLLLIEGWMLGFTKVPEASLPDPNLIVPNRALDAYDRWYRQIDAWIVLRAQDPHAVVRWRIEAEERMKASGQPGLSRADIEDYIRRFLPAYETWKAPPPAVPADRVLELKIDRDRNLLPSA